MSSIDANKKNKKCYFETNYLKKCPRGYRPSTSSLFNVCQPCANDLTLYDYMYLGFMLNTSLVLHFLFTDHSLQIIEKKTHYLNYLK